MNQTIYGTTDTIQQYTTSNRDKGHKPSTKPEAFTTKTKVNISGPNVDVRLRLTQCYMPISVFRKLYPAKYDSMGKVTCWLTHLDNIQRYHF